MSDRFFFERKMINLGNRSFFAHFCSFALFEKAIDLFVALLKRAKKEQSLICSFTLSYKMSDRFFALFQRANERLIAQLLF